MCVCVVGRVGGGFFFACRAVERDLPRKTVSLVVALVSPTLLEATHSYMASSRGVRNGWILSTEPEPSSNSITCRCERQDMLKEIFLFTMGEGPSAEKTEKKQQKKRKTRKKQKQHCRGHLANNTDGDWHSVYDRKAAAYLTLNPSDLCSDECCTLLLCTYRKSIFRIYAGLFFLWLIRRC